MTVADYIFASMGAFACLAWALLSYGSLLTPVPGPAAEQRKGCASAIAGLLAMAYFIGVLWTGEWGWLA